MLICGVAGGASRAEFFPAPPSGIEGHFMMFQEPEVWKPVVERFPSTLGG